MPADGSPPIFPNVEPSIDDLTQELSQLKSDLSDISSSIEDIRLLRDQIIDTPLDTSPSDLFQPRKQLSSLTTLTGDKILNLSEPLAELASKVDFLGGLASEGRAAATSLEIGVVKEELEAVRMAVKEAMQVVVEEADEEKVLIEESKERWREIIAKDNPTLSADGVRVSLNDAVRGLESKVAELDPSSYAGRFAIEHPFTELSKLISIATDVHRSASLASHRSATTTATGLQRVPTHSSIGTTLVGTDYYSKEDAEDGSGDVESQLLRADSTQVATTADGKDKALYGLLPGKYAVKYHKLDAYMRVHWRDVLVRGGLALILLGGIAGLIAWQSIERKDQVEAERHPSSASSSLPSATSPSDVVAALTGGHTLI
ncbi:hypothetical protein ACM66B_000573 [Microbotryomycetes sp. NB124-2]